MERLSKLAESGDTDAARELLQLARRQNNLDACVQAARCLRDEAALLETALLAWDKGNDAVLTAVLQVFGLELSTSDTSAIRAALTGSNGRRRSNLLKPADVLKLLIETRRIEQPAFARFPSIRSLGWMKRPTDRGYAAITPEPQGPWNLEIGVEHAAAYTAPVHLQTLFSGDITPVPERFPSEEAAADAEDTIPFEVQTRLDAMRHRNPNPHRHPDPYWMMLDLLHDIRDAPCYPRVLSLIESRLNLWWPEERNASPKVRSAYPSPHRSLITHVRDTLTGFIDAPPLPNLRHVNLMDTSCEEDFPPDVLQRFPIEHMKLPNITSRRDAYTQAVERLLTLRFPASLDSVTITSRLPGDAFLKLLHNLQRDCPQLTTVRLRADAMPWRDALPAHIQLSLWDPDPPPEDVAADLHSLTIDRLEPGQLAATFPNPERLTHLRSLTVRLPKAHPVYGKQPEAAYTFTPEDVAVIQRIPSLTHLEMSGRLGPDLTAALAPSLSPSLEHLALPFSEMGNTGLKALLDAGCLRSVRHLNLHKAKLKDKGAGLLACDAGPQAPEHLTLSKGSLSKAAVGALADWRNLTTLRRLDLREVNMSTDNRQRILTSRWLNPDAVMFL